jgi:hypothetical protein
MKDRQTVLSHIKRAEIAFLVALFLLPAVLYAQEKSACTIPDCDQAKDFFAKVQKAIVANQQQDAAELMNYPLYSYRGGKTTVIKNKADFLDQYANIFDLGTICAIRTASVNDVWGNWRGFTVNAGAVWWSRIIPNSVKRKGEIQPADLAKFPFGVITVNHSPEREKGCAATTSPANPQ